MFHASIEPLLEPFCQWQRGVWRSSTGPHFDVFNPATGALLATVADQGAAVAKAAITHAHEALPAWQAKSAKERQGRQVHTDRRHRVHEWRIAVVRPCRRPVQGGGTLQPPQFRERADRYRDNFFGGPPQKGQIGA